MLGATDEAVDVEVPVLTEVLVRLYRHRQPRGVGAVKDAYMQKIRGLGSVIRALVRLRFTQPSTCIFRHFCTK